MGGGSWDSKKFRDYTSLTKMGVSFSVDGSYTTTGGHQEIFKMKSLDSQLNPYKVVRECRDSEEHPNTIPVILALDVTGSMGQAAVDCAQKLNVIMTKLYEEVKDVEFMIMGIGDFAYDSSPLQVSQFESDIRIAEQLDALYFEFGGGGNSYESYTSAWYFGLKHTDLDCWKRGKKGIIITMGDERLNPYIPKEGMRTTINKVLGDTPQADVETEDLYKLTCEKFNVYHINVIHDMHPDNGIPNSFKILGQKFREATIDKLSDEIVAIVKDAVENDSADISKPIVTGVETNEKGEVTW